MPNVLMLVTDNQSADSLGCYGNAEHETPRLDRLAREGALFLRAFCTNGLCSPTRASILTGLMPSQHGVHIAMPDDDVMPKADDYDVTREFRTLPYTLRSAGYATAMVGKWHLGNYRHVGHGFDHWVAFTRGHTTDFYDNEVFTEGRIERITGQHIVEHFADRAIDYLAARRPNSSVLPPGQLRRSVRPAADRRGCRSAQPVLRALRGPHLSTLSPHRRSPHPHLGRTVRLRPRPEPRSTRWRARSTTCGGRCGCTTTKPHAANVAAQNALVDHAVGRVVDAIDAEGSTNDTLVIITTDQGNPYGQRGLWGHPQWTDPPFMHDVTFRVPLIIRRPGTVAPQRVVDRVVSHYDLFATVLDHVGVTDVTVEGSPGRSFEAMLGGGHPTEWTDEAYFEAETARSIRTPGIPLHVPPRGHGRLRAL